MLENRVEHQEKIILTGELNSEEQRQKTRTLLEEKWDSGIESLKIDFSGVTAIDFDSLTDLLMIRNRFLHAETEVELINIPERINRIMRIFQVPVSEKHGNQYL
ncbi:MAG: hypothetical protein DRZ90_00490 [Spirochaetes bacterium]|nr:MAG: hypothetical protein DRP49_01195 [Spirochaetota bacterium]RKX80581.1 MAG: hypothetical protein DRP60_02840 [Spirochaetota bacterium]RKX99046.1 MAG: hypothetical protein DRZ90_00490 [Spirochaetota bacterium]